MSGTIFLIAESEDDAEIVQKIVNAKGFKIKVDYRLPEGGAGGISALLKSLERLIKAARLVRKSGDCIVVLHDADAYQPEHEEDRKKIREICARNKDVTIIIAEDEIESWLLADTGICGWLKAKPQIWDKRTGNKEQLHRLLDKQGLHWRGSDRKKVLDHLSGDGDELSGSMRSAVHHLENAPCAQDRVVPKESKPAKSMARKQR